MSTATLTDIFKLVNRLAAMPKAEADKVLAMFEAEKGGMSDAMRAVFQIADEQRKAKPER